MRRRRKKVRKSFFTKKKITIFLTSLIVLLVGSAFMLGMGGMFTEYEEVEEIVEVEKETGKVNFLLVGVDKEASLTDTIMVASFDLDEAELNILSVPRDTRMYIGSRYQKINSAYSIKKDGKKKGINGTIEAVSRLTDIPLNFYVEFSLDAFRETIDALGGIYYDVPQNMNYDDPEQGLASHLKKGYQLLDGNKAEQLVRFRNYPMGDIDRTKVQQGFIKALAEQKLNVSIIENIPDLYRVVSKNLKTNLEIGNVAKYALNVADLTPEKVNMYSLPGEPNNTDYGASYWIADIPKLKELIQITFGYDATNATIHSKDGSSVSKDKKLVTPTPTPTSSPEPKETSAPKSTASATKTPKPTVKPEKTKVPDETKAPEVTATVKPTKAPETDTPETTKEPGGIKRPSAN